MRETLRTATGRTFAAAALALVAATAAGLVLLWPGGGAASPAGSGLAADTEPAEVRAVDIVPCGGAAGGGDCVRAEVEFLAGPAAGEVVTVDAGIAASAPPLRQGDRVRISSSGGATGGAYSISDFERGGPMLWLALSFCLLVVAFGRLRGALSLVGLAASLAIVVGFVLPALMADEPPLAVAAVGAYAVMLVTIPLAHGLGPKSLAAILGTAVSLALTIGLAVVATRLTRLTGLSSEEATLLQLGDPGLSVSGLLVAGIVIGALGVLDDMTISQASAVGALRAANPALGFRDLYSRGLRVGRDHVSATVNTLVLAYVGASLPVLLVFSIGDLGVLEAANVELVAREIVAMLVGSIGLIAAAPITTALAAALAVKSEPTAAVAGAHAH